MLTATELGQGKEGGPPLLAPDPALDADLILAAQARERGRADRA
jgi:hypothetical protein